MNTRISSIKTAFMAGASLGIVALFSTSDAFADNLHPYKVGVYEGAGCDGVTGIGKFQTWSGRAPGRALDFLPGYSKWSDMGNIAWWSSCWKGQPQDVVWSLSMLPKDGVSTLAQGAAGAYDAYFTKLGADLVAGGYGNAVIRLGWEFNGNWFPWSAAQDPASFIAFWHRIVTLMRATPGAQFEFDWCAGAGWSATKADTYYPGDAYVDIIGLDIYNQWWSTADKDPKTRWNDLVYTTYGLYWQKTFAKTHGKQVSFPEWGTGTTPSGHGAGDDPLFVQNMLTWMKNLVASRQPDVAYQAYWDYPAPDYNAKLSDNHQLLSGAAYLQYVSWDAPASATTQLAAKAVPKQTSSVSK